MFNLELRNVFICSVMANEGISTAVEVNVTFDCNSYIRNVFVLIASQNIAIILAIHTCAGSDEVDSIFEYRAIDFAVYNYFDLHLLQNS